MGAATTEKKGLWKRIKAMGGPSKHPPATLTKKQRPTRLELQDSFLRDRDQPANTLDISPLTSHWHRHSALGFSTPSPSGKRSFTSNRWDFDHGTEASSKATGTVGSKSLLEIMAFAGQLNSEGTAAIDRRAEPLTGTGQAYWEDLRKSVVERRSSALSGSTLAAFSDALPSRASIASAVTLASLPAHSLVRTKVEASNAPIRGQATEEDRDVLQPLNRGPVTYSNPASPAVRSFPLRTRTQSARSEVSGYTCNSFSSIGEQADTVQPRYREATASASFPMLMQPSFSGRSCTVNFGRMSEESSPRSAFDGESLREAYAGRLSSPAVDGIELEREFTRYIEERFKVIMDVKE